jgi:hypothetical protein
MLLIVTLIPVTGQITKNITTKDTDEKHPFVDGQTWMKTLGGKDSDDPSAIQQTSDEGYIIVGRTKSYGMGGTDVWVIKTDMYGDEIWNTTFGTTHNETESEYGASVVQTSDHGYIITAKIENDFWLIKINENGTEEWIKIYPRNAGYSICQSDDECYVISGYNYTYKGLWIVKVDNSGNEIWQKNFEEIKSDGLSIKQTSDHGYIIAGWNCILKTDENGTEKWNITLSDDIKCQDVLQSNDGNYAVIGWKGNWAHNNTGWFMKIDTNGHILSSKNYLRIFTGYILNKFVQTPDGGYLITGEADREIEPWGRLHLKLVIIKTDENGNIIWRNTYGSGKTYDCGVDIQKTSDGGYIVLGMTHSYGAGDSDIWLIKADANGKMPVLYRFLNLFPILKKLL